MAEIKNIKNQARANTMTNLEKYNKIFIGMFHKTEEELPGSFVPPQETSEIVSVSITASSKSAIIFFISVFFLFCVM